MLWRQPCYFKNPRKIQSLPKPLLERLLVLSDSLIYESRLVLEDCFEKMPDGRADDWFDCHGIYLRKQTKIGKERCLSSDFAKNISLFGLEERPEQQKVCFSHRRGYETPLPNFLQAQAGLGKDLWLSATSFGTLSGKDRSQCTD